MRSLLLLLVVTAAVNCQAGFITVRTQTYPESSGGTLYVLGGQQGAQPSMLGALTRVQLQPLQVQIQGNGAVQAFSSVFTDRRSSLFDSSLSAWMDQQIAALDNLQAALDAAPQMRMPCPRAAAAAQANMPDVMSYLASSRFGPAFFDALAQQEMQDDEDRAAYDNVDDDEVFGDNVRAGFDAGGIGEYAAEQWANDFTWEQPEDLTTEVEGVTADGRGFFSSMLAEEDGLSNQEGVPSSMMPALEDEDGPAWVFVMDDGSINWGLIMFLLLAFGVLYIWIQFWTTFFRLVRAHRQQRLQEAAAAASTTVPLLAEWKGVVAPLAPEKPMAEKAASEIFKSVQIAKEQTPRGTFFAPRGNEYVTIAYVPLKGEH